MKNTAKVITCGTSALFAAVLCLQAQSTTPSQPATTSPSQSSQTQSTRDQSQSTTPSSNRYDIGSDRSSRASERDSSSTDRNSQSSQNNSRFQIGGDTSTSTSQSTTQSSLTASTEADTQVTTIVQQIDQQGPVVVERISTQFADVACTEENARKLVEALHNGTSVTITGDDGKSATFTPTGRLGYGDAYVAMALAAEALRDAGVTGCATPDQWKAVLLGGDLAPSGTASVSTTTTTKTFPGILVLREQHGGWGKVAQTTNVQLGQVVSSARTSLNIDTNSSSTANANKNQSSSSRSVAGSSGESGQQSALGGSQDDKSGEKDGQSMKKEGEKGNSEAGKDNYGQNTAKDNDWNKGKKKGHDKDQWKSDDKSSSYESEDEEERKKNNPDRR